MEEEGFTIIQNPRNIRLLLQCGTNKNTKGTKRRSRSEGLRFRCTKGDPEEDVVVFLGSELPPDLLCYLLC